VTDQPAAILASRLDGTQFSPARSNTHMSEKSISDFGRLNGPETAFGKISKRRGWQHRHGPEPGLPARSTRIRPVSDWRAICPESGSRGYSAHLKRSVSESAILQQSSGPPAIFD